MIGEAESHNHMTATVEAELRTKVATSQIYRFGWTGGVDNLKHPQNRYWLDLCLTPRPPDARACYPDRWGRHRFERIGEVFLVPPGEMMHARCETEEEPEQDKSQQSIVCQIESDLISEWYDGELEWTDERLETGLNIPDRSIFGLLMRLTRETNHPGFASETILELVACQLAIELGRLLAVSGETPGAGGLAAWRLRLIDERVRELGKAPTLAELAALCNLSVRQLSRGFQISRGCSVGSYVEQTRIEYSKRLIMQGESIKNVSHLMGFSSPSSFSYAFRRATGISPGRYRQLA